MQVSQLRHDLSMKDELLQFYTNAAEESDGESASTTPWVHILDNLLTWYLCHGYDWYLKLYGYYYFLFFPDKCTNVAKYIFFSEDISVYWRRHISLWFFFAVFAEMTRLSRSQITSLWIHCRRNSRTWRKRTLAFDQRWESDLGIHILPPLISVFCIILFKTFQGSRHITFPRQTQYCMHPTSFSDKDIWALSVCFSKIRTAIPL